MYDLIDLYKVPTPPEDFAVYQVFFSRIAIIYFYGSFLNTDVVTTDHARGLGRFPDYVSNKERLCKKLVR